jgi:hypothetical protein
VRRARAIARAIALGAVQVALFGGFAASGAYAADVGAVVAGDKVDVTIRGVVYPDTLSKDLKSGLTNRILVRITLLAAERIVAQKAVEMTVKYDLWDETFRTTVLVEGAVTSEQVYKPVEQVFAFLESPRLPALFLAGEAPRGVDLTLRAELLLNPIEKERLEKIRQWVAQNSVPAKFDPAGGASLGRSTATAIFNSIFEQYASSGSAAVWRTTVTSRPFKLAP